MSLSNAQVDVLGCSAFRRLSRPLDKICVTVPPGDRPPERLGGTLHLHDVLWRSRIIGVSVQPLGFVAQKQSWAGRDRMQALSNTKLVLGRLQEGHQQ